VLLERTSAALVLETANLRSDPGRVTASLARLLSHLARQTVSLTALESVVVVHEGFDAPARAALDRAAGRAITWLEVAPGTDYYEAKNLGFDATRAAIVAFGDADCWPSDDWLERLLEPFADHAVEVAAGRTTYRPGVLGLAATSVDFLYHPSPHGTGTTANFYANNVAFRRETFATRRFAARDDIYRGQCQLLGMRLAQDGVAVRFVPAARTVHRFPDGWADFLALRLHRGADCRAVSPRLVRQFRPHLAPITRSATLTSLAVLAGRTAVSLRSLDALDMPAGPARRACAALAMLGITALDAAGAVFSRRRAGAVRSSLGYHDDGDHLGR
jgi:hypothetical protein